MNADFVPVSFVVVVLNLLETLFCRKKNKKTTTTWKPIEALNKGESNTYMKSYLIMTIT